MAPGHDDFHQRHEDGQHQPHHREGSAGEDVSLCLAVLLKRLRVQRDEGCSHGAFREQAAEQIGKLEGDEEGIGHRAGAQEPGNEDVAGESSDTA